VKERVGRKEGWKEALEVPLVLVVVL